MKTFKQTWNKIKSFFYPLFPSSKNKEHKTDIIKNDENSSYSETIDGVVYVTKENAIRLIKDKKNTPPSVELKESVKSAMFESLIESGYDNQKEILSGFTSTEISELVGSKKDSQLIASDEKEKEKFMKETGAQTRLSKETLAKDKEDIKAKIPSQQAARSKAIKKKKTFSTPKKRKK